MKGFVERIDSKCGCVLRYDKWGIEPDEWELCDQHFEHCRIDLAAALDKGKTAVASYRMKQVVDNWR
jgi:hypothetical protein